MGFWITIYSQCEDKKDPKRYVTAGNVPMIRRPIFRNLSRSSSTLHPTMILFPKHCVGLSDLRRIYETLQNPSWGKLTARGSNKIFSETKLEIAILCSVVQNSFLKYFENRQ